MCYFHRILVLREVFDTHIVLCALYLRGAPRPCRLARRNWSQVSRILRQSACGLGQSSAALRRAGLEEEAFCLEERGLLSWAEMHAGLSVTPALPTYPARWRDFLRDAAPPALWVRGQLPLGRYIGVVGSRTPSKEAIDFAEQTAKQAVNEGYHVVSGGARGCDRCAEAGARCAQGLIMRVLPQGFEEIETEEGVVDVSLNPPSEPFSTANAMERNALIYAASEATLVVEPRFRQGGSWYGAADALRRRLTTVFIAPCFLDPPDQENSLVIANRAMVALGARSLSRPEDLKSVLRERPQASLFPFCLT